MTKLIFLRKPTVLFPCSSEFTGGLITSISVDATYSGQVAYPQQSIAIIPCYEEGSGYTTSRRRCSAYFFALVQLDGCCRGHHGAIVSAWCECSTQQDPCLGGSQMDFSYPESLVDSASVATFFSKPGRERLAS
jgi:hypothetical protein